MQAILWKTDYLFLLSIILFVHTSVYKLTHIDICTHTYAHAQAVLSVSICLFQIILFSRKTRFSFSRFHALQDSLTIFQWMPLVSYCHECSCKSHLLLNVNKHWLSHRLSGGPGNQEHLSQAQGLSQGWMKQLSGAAIISKFYWGWKMPVSAIDPILGSKPMV